MKVGLKGGEKREATSARRKKRCSELPRRATNRVASITRPNFGSVFGGAFDSPTPSAALLFESTEAGFSGTSVEVEVVVEEATAKALKMGRRAVVDASSSLSSSAGSRARKLRSESLRAGAEAANRVERSTFSVTTTKTKI